MNSRKVKSFLLGITMVVLLAALNYWLFPILFHSPYLTWYLKNGALIGLVTAVVSMTWGDTNKLTGLISSHPLIYLGSCAQLIGVCMFALATQTKSGKKGEKSKGAFLDLIITFLVLILLVVGLLVWLIVVAPLQYFVYLVCGAPARFFSVSPRRAIARVGYAEQVFFQEIGKEEKLPEGWWDTSLASKPVSFTNLLTSLFLLSIKTLIG